MFFMGSSGLTKKAFTVVETIIALFLFVILSGGAFYILRSAQENQSISAARAAVTGEAEISLRALERDIVSARRGTFKYSNSTLELKKPSGVALLDISYKFVPPILERVENGKTQILTKHLKEFKISEGTTAGNTTSTGTYILEILTEIEPAGSRKTQSHKQTVLVVIKEESEAVKDPRFRPSEDVVNNY
ncbi:MAG: hypothetical protein HQM10_24910 [Candidatus Riflebacteria bacterium]|nr:hypothetical protein [Candidatus Riflebacteria bacterium]